MNSKEDPTLADSLRQLADLVDQRPEIADWFTRPSFAQHMTGPSEARNLYAFASLFGVEVVGIGPNNDNGFEYSMAAAKVGVLGFKLQSTYEDYVAAAAKAGDTE